MKEPQLVTGLCLGYGSVPSVSIEYSADGETFSQAGTPVAGEYVTGGSRMYAAFYGHIEARYPAADHRLFEQLEQNPFRNRHLQDRQRRSDRLCRDRHGKPHHG